MQKEKIQNNIKCNLGKASSVADILISEKSLLLPPLQMHIYGTNVTECNTYFVNQTHNLTGDDIDAGDIIAWLLVASVLTYAILVICWHFRYNRD